MRYKFHDLFQVNEDKSITPKFHIQVGTAKIGPSITFKEGITIDGIDFFDFKNFDIEAEKKEDETIVLKGFYKNA